MQRVLLISMPFADARRASNALSVLKPSLIQAGIPCDIEYFNILFRNHCSKPKVYDEVAGYWIIGEWVFSQVLFGSNWFQSERGKPETMQSLFPDNRLNGKECIANLVSLSSSVQAFIEKCFNSVDWNQYEIIGFTSMYSQHTASLALAKKIKENFPEKIIVFGGANCDGQMGKALLQHFPFVNWVFSGEADQSFPQVIKRWSQGFEISGIQGLIYCDESGINDYGFGERLNMDGLPIPDFHDYFQALEKYAPELIPKVNLPIELSRGCWWGEKSQCIFCGVNRRSLKYRTKSPERAKKEIQTLIDTYGIKRIQTVDANLNPDYFQNLLPALAYDDKFKLSEFFVETKTNLNRKEVQLLRQAGTRTCQPGIESFDSEILSCIKKGTTLLQNIQFLKFVRDYGIRAVYNFLYGFPGENPGTYRRMESLIELITHLRPPDVLSPIVLQRFSPIYQNPDFWKVTNIRALPAYQHFYPFKQEDLDNLAYGFDCDFDEKNQFPQYFEPLKKALENWQSLWFKKEPPLLAYEKISEFELVIYDTRPSRLSEQVHLRNLSAFIYLLCDEKKGLNAIQQEIKKQNGYQNNNEKIVEQILDDFIHQKLMVQEKNQYLSLANDLRLMSENESSTLAYLLVTDGKN
jgi:ribosomal peptide maturation radical SAM protein 1